MSLSSADTTAKGVEKAPGLETLSLIASLYASKAFSSVSCPAPIIASEVSASSSTNLALTLLLLKGHSIEYEYV